jgi:ribose transport system substrate-binding protein
MKTKHPAALGLVYVALMAQTGCDPPDTIAPEPKKPRLVFITTGTDSFWQATTAGIEAAARDFKVEFELVADSSNALDQHEADGLAFSPINGAVQLVPARGRTCFLGIDQYKAGRKAGASIGEMLPLGGKVIIIYDRLDSEERRQGALDELSDSRFVLVDSRSKDAIAQHTDAAYILVLSARHLPGCLEALCIQDKLGVIKIVAFDEDDKAIECLATGSVHAVISQQLYQYGYHSVRVLAGLARGDLSVLPKNGFLEIPTVVLRNETASHTAARALD